jgi:hemin uptake protein HemP
LAVRFERPCIIFVPQAARTVDSHTLSGGAEAQVR